MSGLDIIYLLNPKLGIGNFPNEFETGWVEITFEPAKGLAIKDDSQVNSSLKLIIEPINQDCEEPTSNEIRFKLYN